MDKEIVLSKLAKCFSKKGILFWKQSEMKKVLKCCGLGYYYYKYEEYLEPNSYNGHYINENFKFNLYEGLDSIFYDLYKEGKVDKITELLEEIVDSMNIEYIEKFEKNILKELLNLYNLMGLKLEIIKGSKDRIENIIVSTFLGSNDCRIESLFTVEKWLKDKHKDVYSSYKGALNSYTSGNFSTSIEACRTAYVSFFTKFKGEDSFSKWQRGIFNFLSEVDLKDVEAFDKALKQLQKKDLADFFKDNLEGKLSKTKTFYMFYSFMSDYGTHRNEAQVEAPTQYDALFILRILDSIFFWAYERLESEKVLM